MNSSLDGLLVAAVIVLSAVLGGGMYEHLVIDPSWPKRLDLIQPSRGGVRRGRFWLPAHLLFEVLLLCSLAASWKLPAIRLWLLAALGIHIATRLWSAFDFIPKALAFEKADVIDETLARKWILRSKFRLPLELLTLSLLLNAVRVAFGR
jgi:hypothetical protein